ncbi:MAG: hypothetical protein UV59_C0008G0020 [Candidatus Gottesmanbacteria bacterium GW2011_GWA1_43_11]|uniref:Uncharacterized protein n=1 Tax=Candidatus Gottesmanbacteria bacterium GW2011_GWA1_43_11 TaxID=1618436 RepID=A0A0G1CIL2_9BACT|nr:MAG: hypothetical protein UV59_C0008G0020 [Candidatus Gottesmanbacteria bacterium GW2011_GWA1_43_11]
MSSSDFRKREGKKMKKSELEKRAQKIAGQSPGMFTMPEVLGAHRKKR